MVVLVGPLFDWLLWPCFCIVGFVKGCGIS